MFEYVFFFSFSNWKAHCHTKHRTSQPLKSADWWISLKLWFFALTETRKLKEYLTKSLLFQLEICQLWFKALNKKMHMQWDSTCRFCLFLMKTNKFLLLYKQDSFILCIPVLLLPYWKICCLLSNHNMN